MTDQRLTHAQQIKTPRMLMQKAHTFNPQSSSISDNSHMGRAITVKGQELEAKKGRSVRTWLKNALGKK
jgi:hypothetical protein